MVCTYEKETLQIKYSNIGTSAARAASYSNPAPQRQQGAILLYSVEAINLKNQCRRIAVSDIGYYAQNVVGLIILYPSSFKYPVRKSVFVCMYGCSIRSQIEGVTMLLLYTSPLTMPCIYLPTSLYLLYVVCYTCCNFQGYKDANGNAITINEASFQQIPTVFPLSSPQHTTELIKFLDSELGANR